MIFYGSATCRYIECLQVGLEQVIIEIRPANLTTNGNQTTNKWMQPAHWDELYEILIEGASDHIKSLEKYTDPRKGQGPLLKIVYQFKPLDKTYQDLLSPYEYHSGYPLLALETIRGDFRNSNHYRSILVALVFPSEEDIKGFDNFPTVHLQPENQKGHGRDSQCKGESVSPLQSHSEINNENPGAKLNYDNASSSSYKTQKSTSNFVEVEPFYSDNEATGASPLWCKEETIPPLASDGNSSDPINKKCLEITPEYDSPDIFTGYEASEGDYEYGRRSSLTGGGYSHMAMAEYPASQDNQDTYSFPPKSQETDSQQSLQCAQDSDSVPKKKCKGIEKSFSKKKKWKCKPVPTKTADENFVESEGDLDSQPHSSMVLRRQLFKECTGSKAHESKLEVRSKKKSKSRCVSEAEDERNKVIEIRDSSQESSDDFKSCLQDNYDKKLKTEDKKQKERDSETEVTFVNSVPPISNDQRKLYLLFCGGKKGESKKLPSEREVDVEITTKDTIGAGSTSTHFQSKLNPVPNTEVECPSESKQYRFDFVESGDEIEAQTESSKRKRSFSKFECERSGTPSFEESIHPSTSFPCHSDYNERKKTESMPSSSSSIDSGQNLNDDLQPSRLRKRNIFGLTEIYGQKERSPKKISSPTKVAGLPLSAQDAQNSENEANVKSPMTKTNNAKAVSNRPMKQSEQATKLRRSPRKPSFVSNNEPVGILEDQPREIKTPRKKSKLLIVGEPAVDEEQVQLTTERRKLFDIVSLPHSNAPITPKKKNKRGIEARPVGSEDQVELTDEQKKFLEKYSLPTSNESSAHKPTVGENNKNTNKKCKLPSRGSKFALDNAQKRVRKSKIPAAKRKKGKKDTSSGQITNYFSKSTQNKVDAAEASTSTSNLKARVVEEARLESLCQGMFNSGDDSDSSDDDVPLCLINRSLASHPSSKENSEENVRFIKTIENLSLDKITKSFKKNSALFHGIFKERIPCERHELYKAGDEERNNLRYSTATNPFSDKQLSHMMDLLTKAFCQEHPLHFVDYMWKVLIPELANHVFMDEFNLDYHDSLKKIHELYIFSQDSD